MRFIIHYYIYDVSGLLNRLCNTSCYKLGGVNLPDSQHHLQIDAVSLYLLYLVQMISSGIQVGMIIGDVKYIP